MSASDFEFLKKIGSGTYSKVYKVRRRADRRLYALKKVTLLSLNEREQENALTEVRILASVRHQNVIGFREAFIGKDNCLHIVMEYANCGDLLSMIRGTRSYFLEPQIWDVLIQLAQGLSALHKLNIVHRDLKSANVFLSKDGTYKIGDMNVSKVATRPLTTQTGTPYYASPEVWNKRAYNSKSDMWSLGCVVYELAALRPPFEGPDMGDLYKQVNLGKYPAIPAMYSFELGYIIGLLLKVDPNERPSCEELLDLAVVQKHITKDQPGFRNKLINNISMPREVTNLKLPAANYEESFLPALPPRSQRILKRKVLKVCEKAVISPTRKSKKITKVSSQTRVSRVKTLLKKAPRLQRALS